MSRELFRINKKKYGSFLSTLTLKLVLVDYIQGNAGKTPRAEVFVQDSLDLFLIKNPTSN